MFSKKKDLPVIQEDLHKFSFAFGSSKLEHIDAKVIAVGWSIFTLQMPRPVKGLLQHLAGET